MESGQIDVMFGAKNTYKSDSLQYHNLFSSPICCICSRNHPLAQYQSLTADKLHGPIVLCESHRIPQSLFQLQLRIASSFPEEERFFGDSYESVLTLVKAELGYTLLPALPNMSTKTLCCIPLTDQKPFSFGLYYSDTDRSWLFKRFWQIMKSCLEEKNPQTL